MPAETPETAATLRFLTWNVAMLERSAQAPPGWELHDTEAAIRDTILASAPDLVLYQELPGMVPFVETHDMLRANPKSHQGHLGTLVDHRHMHPAPSVATVDQHAVLATFAAPAVTVANVHLAPGPGAAGERLEQLAAVVEASPTEALVIVGDTNTRVGEIAAIEDAGFVSTRPPRPTWDSRRNRFHPDLPEFTSYFTRWFASPGVSVSDVQVLDRPIERDRSRFHISDHFALTGTIAVTG